MKVEFYRFNAMNNYPAKSVPVFRHYDCAQTVKNINIGTASDGLIGKIKVRKGNNTDAVLNVIKKNLGEGYENYSVQNNENNIVGEIILKVNKYTNYDRFEYQSDPSHVFVDELKNYSNPNTPYFKNLEYYKDIGTRLLQIALKRSYESMCNGMLKLVAKNESKEWYKKIIGMTEEFPNTEKSVYGFSIHNPNSMILPPEAKEHLLNLQGGL